MAFREFWQRGSPEAGEMLYIIGMGLHDEKDLSLRGVDALKKCSRVYAEFYTSPVKVNVRNLEKITGKKIEVLERKDVEGY